MAFNDSCEADVADGPSPPDQLKIMHEWACQLPNATSSRGTDGQQVQDTQPVIRNTRRKDYLSLAPKLFVN